MLRRLTAAQEQFPLALEMLNLEQETLGQTGTERILNPDLSDQR
jgi:hypothetical protein